MAGCVLFTFGCILDTVIWLSFQLYELSDDPKRKEFLDDLFSFMQKRGESQTLQSSSTHTVATSTTDCEPPPIARPYQCPQLTCLSRVSLFRVRLATIVTTNHKQRALVSAHKPTITDALPISCLITLCCLSIISQSHHTVIHNAPLGVINNINRRILNQ